MSDGFLSRWARRKREARAAERPEAATPEGTPGPDRDLALDTAQAPRPDAADGPPPAAADGPPAAGPPEAQPSESEDALAGLPSLDALTPETDLAPFLRAGVPAVLRNAALRRMWSLDPAIRDFVSEAREYAYDWNAPGGVPGLGPLLPGDDVKAMLRRLVGALPEDEAPGPGAAVAGEGGPGTAPPPAAEEAGPRPGQERERSSDGSEESEPPGASAALSQIPLLPTDPALDASRGRSAAAEGASGPAARAVPAATVPEGPKPRLRRHGGAMPA